MTHLYLRHKPASEDGRVERCNKHRREFLASDGCEFCLAAEMRYREQRWHQASYADGGETKCATNKEAK